VNRTTFQKISPDQIGFDFDGVIADIAEAFLRIACEEYNFCSFSTDDITSFQVEECLDIPIPLVEGIFNDILRDSVSVGLKPMPGMIPVIMDLADQAQVTIITARPQRQPVVDWLDMFLPARTCRKIKLIAMGDHDGKVSYIKEEGLIYFVDDRPQTCNMLFNADITPVVFSQPWNRNKHSFRAVENWQEIHAMVHPPESLSEK
jgi:uncharacterized protein